MSIKELAEIIKKCAEDDSRYPCNILKKCPTPKRSCDICQYEFTAQAIHDADYRKISPLKGNLEKHIAQTKEDYKALKETK